MTTVVARPGRPPATLTRAEPAPATPDDLAAVAALLGRPPAGDFAVVVRRPDGTPSVIANSPLLFDGTPMPTRYWLLDPVLRDEVSRLESTGGVRAAERAVDPVALARAHRLHAAERGALLPPAHAGPAPSGGVGGTRQGVKCLHAHLAWWLAGGDDPVGDWVAGRLGLERPLAEGRGPESRPPEARPSQSRPPQSRPPEARPSQSRPPEGPPPEGPPTERP